MIDQIYAAPKGGDLKAGIDFAIEHGLNYELPTFYHVENLDGKDQEIARYNELLTGFKGKLSLHGPIFDVNVVSLDPEIERISRRRYLQAINIAKEMGVKYVVLHSQWTPIYPAANCTKQWLNKLVDYWEQMVEAHLEDSGVTVLIENFLDQDPETMNLLLSRVNSPHLKACLDTGHVNIFSELSVVDWLRELGSHVAYIHTHNNNGSTDEHQAFDKGIIDLEGFIHHVAMLPRKIDLAIETNDVESLAHSYEMVRPHLKTQEEEFAAKSFLI